MSEKRGTHTPSLKTYWQAPRLFSGQDVFVLGNGPSLQNDPLERLAGKNVIAVNSAAFVLPKIVKVLFFGDARWYWLNKPAVQALDALKVTLSKYWVDETGSRREEPCSGEPGICTMRQKGQSGLTLACDALAWNMSSGGAAVNLASHLGAKRIILLGYDMKLGADGARNAFPNLNKTSVKFDTMNVHKSWRSLYDTAIESGIQIINATPGSALHAIPQVNLDDVLRSCA